MGVDVYAANRRMEIMFPGIAEENHARATLSASELAEFYRNRDTSVYEPDENDEIIATINYIWKDGKVVDIQYKRVDDINLFFRLNDYIADAIIKAINKIPYKK